METNRLLSRLFHAVDCQDAALQKQLFKEIDQRAPWLRFPEVLQVILRAVRRWSSGVERAQQLDQLEIELRAHFLEYSKNCMVSLRNSNLI